MRNLEAYALAPSEEQDNPGAYTRKHFMHTPTRQAKMKLCHTLQVMLAVYWDNGKENGNYYIIIGYILGLYWDNGRENGNYN